MSLELNFPQPGDAGDLKATNKRHKGGSTSEGFWRGVGEEFRDDIAEDVSVLYNPAADGREYNR